MIDRLLNDLTAYSNGDLLIVYLKNFKYEPRGSWSMAMTRSFSRIALCSGVTVRKSFDMIKGADQIDQIVI